MLPYKVTVDAARGGTHASAGPPPEHRGGRFRSCENVSTHKHCDLEQARTFPPELRELAASRYVVEAVEEGVPALSPEEEARIEAALESDRQRPVLAKRAREIIDAALGR
jgi:hypothetical protein